MKFQKNGSILGRIAMVIGVITTFTANTATAQWAHHGRSDAGCGYSGQAYSSQGYSSQGYGSLGYGSSGGGFAGGSSGGEQSTRRLFGRVHNHHAMRRESRHSVGYGSHGGYGSSGGYGSHGGYGSSGYGVRTSYATLSPYVAASSPNNQHYATIARTRPGASSLANVRTANDTTIRFTVELEPDTQLYMNEKLTTNSGSVRQFVSSNLTPGKSYQFNVRADLMGSDGKLHSQTRQLTVRAGDRVSIKILPQDRYKNVVASHESKSKYALD